MSREPIPLDDGYEDSLVRRELCACGDVLITPRFASSENVERAVWRHNQRARHRAWAKYDRWPR